MTKILNELIFKYASIVDENDIILNDDTNLIYDLGYNSLTIIQLVIDIEEKYNIEIEDIIKLHIYGTLKRYVLSHYYYKEYYNKYLGIDTISKIGKFNFCKSDYRLIPINKKFVYYGILTKYKEEWILSCSDEYKAIISESINKLNESNDIDYYMNNLLISDLNIRKMYRMIWDGVNLSSVNLNPDYEYVYLETLNKYVAKINGTVISYCKISDINHSFGNIVTYTNENFRNQGLATTLLNLLLTKCQEKHILPLYIVDTMNISSVNLAKKLGFSIVSEEIVMSKELII